MSNFFNGADANEVAGLNLSNSNLGIIVKQHLATEENVNELTTILNDDSIPEFDKEVRLVSQAMESCPAMREYSMHDVRSALSRRLNTMSRTIARNHGFNTYLTFARGKVKKAELLLEQKAEA